MKLGDRAENPLPRRLKHLRKEAGISQMNLGIQAGMEESTASGRMAHYENARYTPVYVWLKRIAEVLNAPVSYFYTANDEEAKFILIFHRLPKVKREQMMQLAENLESE